MSIENKESKQPDDTRSPGVTDRDAIAPENTDLEVNVVRRPIVWNVTDVSANPDDPRSPGLTDRDISIEEITASSTEETEIVRKPIILDAEIESEE